MVIGSCGAGKSTLSTQIGSIKNLPVIHLDQLYWKPNWVEPMKAEFAEKQVSALSADKWIVDGNYGGTMNIRMELADTIVWLDLPMPICLFRVLKRIVKNYGKTRFDMGTGCDERFDFEFLHYVISFPWHGRRRLVKKMKNKQDSQTLIHLKSRGEVKAFLKEIAN